MTDSTITLEFPRTLFATSEAAPQLSSRLERIVERNLDHGLTSTLFALATAAFTVLTALGIAGY
jgi:hypothetical protein